MDRLFGTDGVRGVANSVLTAELALQLGRAGAQALTDGRGSILVGRDTRISGDMLEAALVAGIASTGAEAILLGVVPTPAVAYLTRRFGVEAGVVISASHNPVADNGIKFFSGDGYKLSDEVETQIEASLGETLPLPVGAGVGRINREEDAWLQYAQALISAGAPLDGFKLVVDCAAGAAYHIAPYVFERLGADVEVINAVPNGVNINVNCGSTHPEQVKEAVLAYQADVGIAFDGDADRVIAVDERGRIVNGDVILAICGVDLLRAGTLPHNTVVATQYSNLGLELALRKEGGRLVTTQAGDRYVLEKMRVHGYTLGGEQSGHIIFLQHATTGDGILTALQLLSIMKRTGQKLSALAEIMQPVPQQLLSVRVGNKNWVDNAVIQAEIAAKQALLGEQGRLFVRASGTEPLLRVLVEGLDGRQVEEIARDVAAVIAAELG
ncbi:MAG TPA: phosphoglucosamine mutase [Firmicutes bacterium]|jgi:phosphoglucosamine mutase|nr:phosphoglucosamine mutase [Bacillota bacterium]